MQFFDDQISGVRVRPSQAGHWRDLIDWSCRSAIACRWLAAVLICSGVNVLAEDAQQPTEATVSRLLARDQAIQAATFSYDYGSFYEVRDVLDPLPWEEDQDVRRLELSIVGEEWALRWRDSDFTSMHRHDQDISFVPNSPEQRLPGEAGALLSLDPSFETISESLKSDPKFWVIRAGRLPVDSLTAYVDARSADVNDGGRQLIGDVETRILELVIPGNEFGVLGPVLSSVTQSDEMLLRCFVAEELGCVVVRTDYCLTDGTVTSRFEGRDFSEIAPSIWFPARYSKVLDFTAQGRGFAVNQYLINSVRNVNDPADDTFRLEVPADTVVYDNRSPSVPVTFSVNADMQLPDVEKRVRQSIPHKPDAPVRSGSILIFANAALLLITSICLIVLRVRKAESRNRADI